MVMSYKDIEARALVLIEAAITAADTLYTTPGEHGAVEDDLRDAARELRDALDSERRTSSSNYTPYLPHRSTEDGAMGEFLERDHK
jgi:hypothetical protein